MGTSNGWTSKVQMRLDDGLDDHDRLYEPRLDYGRTRGLDVLYICQTHVRPLEACRSPAIQQFSFCATLHSNRRSLSTRIQPI